MRERKGRQAAAWGVELMVNDGVWIAPHLTTEAWLGTGPEFLSTEGGSRPYRFGVRWDLGPPLPIGYPTPLPEWRKVHSYVGGKVTRIDVDAAGTLRFRHHAFVISGKRKHEFWQEPAP